MTPPRLTAIILHMQTTSTLPAIIAFALSAAHLPAGELDPSQRNWFKQYQKQENVPKPGEMLLNTSPEPELSEGFMDLFNGKDLDGWETIGGTMEFDVVEGAIRGTCKPGSPSTYLYTKKSDYTDFIFTCEMKWEIPGNSGVMFRAGRTSPKGKDFTTAIGPQMEMEPFAQKRDWSGGIYGQGCGGWFYPLWLSEHAEARKAPKEHDWNRMTIEARGREVRTWLNGVPIAFWKTDTYHKGAFGLQIHSGKSGTMLWRNLMVKPL